MALGIQVVNEQNRVVSEFKAPEGVALETVVEVLEAEHNQNCEIIVGSIDSVSEPSFDLPDLGEIVVDTEAPHWSDGRVKVVNIPGKSADAYTIKKKPGVHVSVSQENPDHPPSAPVVIGRYQRDNGKESDTYAFPCTRLDY